MNPLACDVCKAVITTVAMEIYKPSFSNEHKNDFFVYLCSWILKNAQRQNELDNYFLNQTALNVNKDLLNTWVNHLFIYGGVL